MGPARSGRRRAPAAGWVVATATDVRWAYTGDTDVWQAAIDCILASRARTRASVAPQLPPKCTNTWKLVAERGLFAYDDDTYRKHYGVDAIPEKPSVLEDLPDPVVALLRGAVFSGLRFAELVVVTKAAAGRRAEGARLVGDVWLYNVAAAPEAADWKRQPRKAAHAEIPDRSAPADQYLV